MVVVTGIIATVILSKTTIELKTQVKYEDKIREKKLHFQFKFYKMESGKSLFHTCEFFRAIKKM